MSWKEVDPLKVWTNSSIVPIDSKLQRIREDKNEPLVIHEHSSIIQMLHELRHEDQDRYLGILVQNWPFKWERRAFEYPLHAIALGCGASGMFVGVKIAGEAFHSGANFSLRQTIKKTSKMITVPPCYITAIAAFTAWTFLVKGKIMRNPDFCPSCMLVRGICISIGCGILLPAFTTPILTHGFAIHQGVTKLQPKNMLENVGMIYEYNRPLFRHLPKLVTLHVAFGAICVYSTLWGWTKIFKTLDVDPEFVREVVSNMPDESKYFARFRNYIMNAVDRINAA